MRPVRLELEGFMTFRDYTVVDFEGADLFALSGPTGSGKSSLVDAMVFALYGTVPRLDRRQVAPVISLGRSEARVRLDFMVDGVVYRAVRVVRRTKNGATTKEARLERADGEVLAGTADELSGAVLDLFGLSYDHFVKCVVLPQGAFAAFLHDTGADRQDVLVRLLDLRLYEDMAAVARRREQIARERFAGIDARLEELAFATPEAATTAASRIDLLERLRADVGEQAASIEQLRVERRNAEQEAQRGEEHIALLAGVELPEGLDARADDVTAAQGRVSDAEAAYDKAVRAADEAVNARAVLPRRTELEAAKAAHDERTRLLEAEAARVAAIAHTEAAVVKAADAAREADAAFEDARAAEEAASWQHRAHDLATRLVAGEPCPVCGAVVDDPATVPAAERSDPLAGVRKRLRHADTARQDAAAAHRTAEREHMRAEARHQQTTERLHDLERLVASHPDPAALAEQLASVTAAESTVEECNRNVRDAARARDEAARALRQVEAQLEHDRAAFDSARDQVAALGPPPVDRHDLPAAWHALVAWAGARKPELAATVAAARARADHLMAECDDKSRRVAAQLERAGITAEAGAAPERDPRAAVEGALGLARAERQRIDDALARREELRRNAVDAKRDAEVAHALALHLSAKGFEKWMLDEALVVLCEGASEILESLSSGSYALTVDERANFAVVDHRNADEVRSARTLSGGETFLASLSLALALADQIGQLAAGGAARLESIILDEGFGTLDPDTLDVVAAAIEELGAHGRMVGLISHIEELAARVPVRYVVHRQPGGSSVEKVVA